MCFLAAIASQISQAVSLLGMAVSLLSAMITLIGAFNEDLDAGIGLDGVHRVQGRVLVALTLVPLLLATVGSAFSLMGLQVTPIGPAVTPIGPAVTLIGVPVTTVGRQVPLSAGIALVGGVVALTGRPVARLTGKVSLRRDVAVQVRSQIASLRRLQTLLRQRPVVPTLCVPIGEGSLHLLCPLLGDPVPIFGDVVARVSHPVTLVGDPVALISHAVTLVGAALALLGLCRHRASPRMGRKSSVGQTCFGSGQPGRERGSSCMRPSPQTVVPRPTKPPVKTGGVQTCTRTDLGTSGSRQIRMVTTIRASGSCTSPPARRTVEVGRCCQSRCW